MHRAELAEALMVRFKAMAPMRGSVPGRGTGILGSWVVGRPSSLTDPGLIMESSASRRRRQAEVARTKSE